VSRKKESAQEGQTQGIDRNQPTGPTAQQNNQQERGNQPFDFPQNFYGQDRPDGRNLP
jgi:hypothetical protein